MAFPFPSILRHYAVRPYTRGVRGIRTTVLLLAARSVGGSYGAYDLLDVDGLEPAFSDELQDAVLFGLDLEVDLVGLELDERLAGFHLGSLALEPFAYRRVGDRLTELRHVYLNGLASPLLFRPTNFQHPQSAALGAWS